MEILKLKIKKKLMDFINTVASFTTVYGRQHNTQKVYSFQILLQHQKEILTKSFTFYLDVIICWIKNSKKKKFVSQKYRTFEEKKKLMLKKFKEMNKMEEIKTPKILKQDPSIKKQEYKRGDK